MSDRPLRLSARLSITHGVFVGLLVVLLVVTLGGLLRMLGLVTEIRDQHLSSVDAEEALHRSAWEIEVSLRHGQAACEAAATSESVRPTIVTAREHLLGLLDDHTAAPEPLRVTAARYATLAESALSTDTCRFLAQPATDQLRATLNEDLTDAWIDRLHDLHADIEAKEDRARRIGSLTALAGLAVAIASAVAAVAIARSTASSVADPIARLAAAATRVGEGDFAPIPPVNGPREVEDLWRDLERARERLRQLDELKQGFLANVSHELRSPLATVREALALLSDGTCGDLSAKQERVVSLAKTACEREVRIVEALLDLSRLRAGGALKVEAACDVRKVVDVAVSDERVAADQRGVAVEADVESDLPNVQMDSALVERAVANLVRNAVSVSTNGKRVTVRCRSGELDGAPAITIEVEDEGPGLSDEIRQSLFRPFTTASVAAVGRPAGVGLGLSFAREVARAHGGDLKLVRSDEHGTTFRFDLPLARGEQE